MKRWVFRCLGSRGDVSDATRVGRPGEGFAGVGDKEVRGRDWREKAWFGFVELDDPESVLFVVRERKAMELLSGDQRGVEAFQPEGNSGRGVERMSGQST